MGLFHLFKVLFHSLRFLFVCFLVEIEAILLYHLLPNIRNKLLISSISLIEIQEFLLDFC